MAKTQATPTVESKKSSAPQAQQGQKPGHTDQVLQRLEMAPASLRPADILHLQRTIGNQATGQLLQAKLKLGPAGDRYEQEADQVAKEVVRASRQPTVQKGDVQREGMEDDEMMQAKPLADSISPVRRAFVAPPPNFLKVQRDEMEDELQASANHGLEGGDVDTDVARSIQNAKGGGQPLHDGVRSSMEQGFGADFSGVRVHTGGQADTLNRSLNAKAFTTGNDIFFGKGQYNPGSTGGQELIAHELTHTVQQGAASVPKKPQDHQNVQRDGEQHGPGCKCGSCSGIQRQTVPYITAIQRSDELHNPSCKCGSCSGVQRHEIEDVQMKPLAIQRRSQLHNPSCKCGSCNGVQRHADLGMMAVQRHTNDNLQMKARPDQRSRGAENSKSIVQTQLQPSIVHTEISDTLQRYSREVVQRHSSWEHKSLGDANPDDLSKIGAWQDLIEQTKKKGFRRRRDTQEATVNVPIGDNGAPTAVKKGDVMHILAQHLKLLDDWQTNPPQHGTAGAIDPTYQTVLVEIPGGAKDGQTPLVVTYGELNTLADYYGNVETMNAADPAIRWRMVQSVRKETFLRLKDIYDQVKKSLTGTEKGQQSVQDAKQMMTGNKLYNQKRDKMPGLSNQFMFDDSIQQDYISSVIGQVNLLKKSGTGTDSGDTNNYSATLARNACHFVPESWHAWSSYHQKARTLALESYNFRQQNDDVEADKKANEAILNNGFGDHYLQDSYAGGHMINKTLIMKWFVEWLDQQSGKMDFTLDKNWRKIQAIAYKQPEFAKAISGNDGQYDKSSVQGYDPNNQVNRAQNPQAVEDIGGDDWMVRFRALGLQVPDSLQNSGSDTRKIVEWWQGGAGAGILQSKTTITGKRLLNSGVGLGFDALKTALNTLLSDGIIHADDRSEKKSTKKMSAFLSGSRTINPAISLNTFKGMKFVLREDYVPKEENRARFNATLQTNNNDAYQKMAAMVTYKDYFDFMNNGYMQKSTNAAHNTFCVNGLTVSSGDGSLTDAKVYGDDNMFNKDSSAGVKHSAETAHMSRDAIRNIVTTGADGGETTQKILNRLPDQVTADVYDDQGRVVNSAKTDIATWHNPNNNGALKQQCFTNIFPSMGAIDKIVGAMGDLTKHLSKDQVHAGEAF